MKVNIRIFLGFLVVIALVIILAGINNALNNKRLDQTNQIKDVEAPLGLMVEQIIGYDAILTGEAHTSLLHAEKGELEGIKKHKIYYGEVGAKLDNLLKFEARDLLEKSKRPQETKDKVNIILKRLDEVNLALVDLELGAFDAMEKGDIEKARSLIVSNKYEEYKTELAQLYNDWGAIEQEVSLGISNQIIQESNQLNLINLYFSFVIILFSLITSFFISSSISKPIKKLRDDVDEITKGRLDIQLEKSSLFEIQSLIDSLNRILATMKLAILRSGLSKTELGLGEIIKAKEEAEKKYGLLYKTSSDAIMSLEPTTGRFTSGNPAAIKMFNVKNEKEFTSLGLKELSPERQPDGQLSSIKSKKMIEKAMKEGSNFFEWTHKRYKGENFLATVLLIKIADGKNYMQATVRDISKEKEAQEKIIKSESFKNAILDNSPDCIKILDVKGRLLYMNRGGLLEHGFKKEEDAIGWDWVSSIDIRQRDEVIKSFKKCVRTGQTISIDVKHVKGKSNREWCNLTIIPMKNKEGKIINVLGVSRDISKEKRLESKK